MGTVVVIEPASAGLALVEAAVALRKDVVLFTGPHGDVNARAAAERCGAAVVEVDTNDSRAVVAAARRLARSNPLEAVVPGMEYFVHTAAVCAEALGLRGIPPAAAARLRSKYEVRRRVAAAGVPTPPFALVGDDGDIERAAAATGFPAVLKPVDASGSLAVKRVDSLDELCELMAGHRRKGLVDVGRALGSAWMLESYLDGPEYSVEGLITDEGPRALTVTKKLLGPEPYFVEMGHVVGDSLPAATQKALTHYTEEVMAALELPLGVFHTEVRNTADGPMLIEVNARLPGDRLVRLVELACGFSLPEAMLSAYIDGPPPARRCKPARKGLAGVRFVTAGDVRRVPGDDELARLDRDPGVDEVTFDGLPERACCAAFRNRVGHVICTAASPAMLETRLTRAGAVLTGTSRAAAKTETEAPSTTTCC